VRDLPHQDPDRRGWGQRCTRRPICCGKIGLGEREREREGEIEGRDQSLYCKRRMGKRRYYSERERERERERQGQRKRERDMYVYQETYVYMKERRGIVTRRERERESGG
jgi:hypothetical protein